MSDRDTDYRELKEQVKKDPRQKMVVSGNPQVLKSARGEMTVNGLTVTHSPTKAWRGGVESGTPVQHADGKNDGKDIGRKRVVTW